MNAIPKKYLKILCLSLIFSLALFQLSTSATALSKTALSPTPILTSEQMKETFIALIEFEADGVFLLDKAILNVKNKKVRNWLSNFKEERKTHIKTLTELLLKNTASKNYTPPTFGKFYKGNYPEPSGSVNDKTILQTLFANEKLIIEAYEKALKLSLPQNAQIKIKNIYKHNKQHNAYLDHLAKTLS